MTKYMIVRLKEREDLRFARFERLSFCLENNILVPDNYEAIYCGAITENLPKPTDPEHCLGFLEELFEKFNLYKPKDFKHYSLSVGDIVIFQAVHLAFFCDSFGWEDITDAFLSDYCFTRHDYFKEQKVHETE